MSPTTSTPEPADPRVVVALAALAEVTDPADVGELVEVVVVEPGVVDLRFTSARAGYPGWHWNVSTSDLPDEPPTVLEVEMLPGEGALLAPAWVPWAERLAEWRRTHPEEPEGDADLDDDELDDEDEEDLDDDLDEDLPDEVVDEADAER